MTTKTLGIPEIEVLADWVQVCGVAIHRPPNIAPSQWLDFWERVRRIGNADHQ